MKLTLLPTARVEPADALLFRLEPHSNFVGGMVVLPDGRTLVTSSEDGRICVIDIATGDVTQQLEGHQSAVNFLALSPDGTRLLSASDDKTVLVWDTASFRLVTAFTGHEDFVSRLAVTPSGKAVSAGKDTTARVWEMETGKELAVFRGHSQWIFGIALVPGKPEAITVSMDGAIKRWNVDLGDETDTQIEEGDPGMVIMVPGTDLFLGRHNTSGVGHENYAQDLAATPDGRWLVSVEKAILIHDLQTGAQRAAHGGDGWVMKRVALSRDGERIYTGGDSSKAWSFDDGHELAYFPPAAGHDDGEVHSLALAPDESALYAGMKSGAVIGWDVKKALGSGPAKKHTRAVRSVVLAPGGKTAATTANDGCVGIWDVTSGVARGFLAHGTPFTEIVGFTRDERTLITGTQDGDVLLWDMATLGRRLAMKKEKSWWLAAWAVTPDEKWLVAGAVGEELTLWNLSEGGAPVAFDGRAKQIGTVALTHDGGRALTTSYLGEDAAGPLQWWDVGARTLVRSMPPDGTSYYSTAAILPGETRAAAGTSDGFVDVWDLETGTRLGHWRVHPYWVTAIHPLDDGTRVGTFAREVRDSEHHWRDPWPCAWREFDVASGREVASQVIPDATSIGEFRLLSRDRALVVIDESLVLWNLKTGAVERSEIAVTAFSAAGSTIVAGDSSGAIRALRLG